jgi:symplekin
MDTALDEEADSAIPGSGALGQVGSGLNNLQLIDFKLPPPKEFSEEDRDMLIRASVSRIWSTADELRFSGEVTGTGAGASAADMWMLLVVRLVTRVAEPPPGDAEEEEIKKKEEDDEMQTGMVDLNFYSHQDRLRQTLCDYVVQDFHSR